MTMTERQVFDRDNLTDDRLRDDLLPGQVAPPLPPLQVVVEDTGSGVRVTVVNDGPLGGRLNGAVRYDAYHADDPVDTTTAAGKAAGFARAVCVGSVPATDVAHTQSSALFADPKYSAGFWYVCGVGQNGTRSAPSEPARVTRGAVDATIPGDVEHLQISESGVDVGGIIFSELSVTCDPPTDTKNFGGVQLYLRDYSALNDTQEGYFHHWNGSGGINFAVPYPIPRRKNDLSLTATSGSNSFTSASGLLATARAGELLELLGERLLITGVTDTAITTSTNWPKQNFVSADFVVIGKPTIFAVSIGKSGTRRGDIDGAPSVAVLMDGDLSTPNAPANVYLTNAGNTVRVEWDQVEGSTVEAYNVYRSPGNTPDAGMASSPPVPSSGTIFLDRVPQNKNAPSNSNYARPQLNDSHFTLYDLEANSEFTWYVSTMNIRGDESAALDKLGTCRRAATGEIDPAQAGRNAGKNFIYNAACAGTVGNAVLANDTSQDAFMGTDGTNLPGKPYGAASGQANGTGRFRGYTRLESSAAGTGAAGAVHFENGDEIHMDAPGAGKIWNLYGEIGAWDESSGNQYKKVGIGEVYTFSFYVNHTGVTPNGTFSAYVEQYDNNTFKSQSKRRFRDTNSNIVTSSTALAVTTSEITATSTRYQAQFQLDSATAPTRQLRFRLSWADGTVGVIVVRRLMISSSEVAPNWTPDMGDTNISIPVATTPVDPVGDDVSERTGDGIRIIPPP